MSNFILTSVKKGKNFEYSVINTKTNKVVATRTSHREYVAATSNGAFFFGRVDLIGKGDHGRFLKSTNEAITPADKKVLSTIAYFVADYKMPAVPKAKKEKPTDVEQLEKAIKKAQTPELTQKERVVAAAAEGLTSKEAAESTGIALANVRWYYSKLKLNKK